MTQPLPNVQPSPRAPKDALLDLITTISGVQTMWRTDKAPSIPGLTPGKEHAWIWMKMASYGSIGTDEEREKYDPELDENRIINVGQRRFTLSVRAESLDANLEAYDLCERVRFRLWTWTARRIFAPANLSIRDVQPMAVFEQTVLKRTLRVATMDIRWNYVTSADPNVPGEGGYIKSVNGGGIIPGRLT